MLLDVSNMTEKVHKRPMNATEGFSCTIYCGINALRCIWTDALDSTEVSWAVYSHYVCVCVCFCVCLVGFQWVWVYSHKNSYLNTCVISLLLHMLRFLGCVWHGLL